MHQINVSKQALKALRKMPRDDADRLRGKLARLSENPRRQDVDVIRLQRRSGYRLRSGNWRVIFERDDKRGVINVLRIAVRGEAHKL